MTVELPKHTKSDENWSDLVADMAASELVAGKLIAPDQFDFAQRIIAQQVYILLISECRPSRDVISN